MIPVIDPITEVLRTVIVSNDFIHVDLWSFVHLILGGLLLFLFSFFIKGIKRFYWVFGVLAIWELGEFIAYGIIKSPLVTIETRIDFITDLVVGMFGALIVSLLLFLKKVKKN